MLRQEAQWERSSLWLNLQAHTWSEGFFSLRTLPAPPTFPSGPLHRSWGRLNFHPPSCTACFPVKGWKTPPHPDASKGFSVTSDSLKLKSAGVAHRGQAALTPPPQAPICSRDPAGLPTAPCTCKDVSPSDLYPFWSLCLDVPPRSVQNLPLLRPCQVLGCPNLPGCHALHRHWLISNCIICTLSGSGATCGHTMWVFTLACLHE